MVSTYENTKCPVCKEKVEQTGKGRPKEYHPDCRKFEQLAGWLENLIPGLPANKECAKNVRSRLWYLGNIVKTS